MLLISLIDFVKPPTNFLIVRRIDAMIPPLSKSIAVFISPLRKALLRAWPIVLITDTILSAIHPNILPIPVNSFNNPSKPGAIIFCDRNPITTLILLIRKPRTSLIVPIILAKNPDSFIPSLILLIQSPIDPVVIIISLPIPAILPISFAIPATTSLMIVTPISITANRPLNVDLSFACAFSLSINFSVNFFIFSVILSN